MKRTAEEVHNLYLTKKSAYAARNDDIVAHRALFCGEHWAEPLSGGEQIAEDAFQLVINYCRSTVLHFVGALAASPRFRVPRPAGDATRRIAAETRERWLAGLRDDLLRAWKDVEMDASKTRYGVLQVLWDPERADADVYEGNPFVFRAIDPLVFYPCYRTLDHADDFFYVIREDPGRLIEDLEETYKVGLQAAESEEGTEGACTVIEYWDTTHYYIVALTVSTTDRRDDRGREYTVTEEQPVLLRGGKHGYPRIPFFVLQNIRDPHGDPTYEGSLSDVQAVAELNKHYDLMASEHAEEILLNIHRPLVYKSDDHQKAPSELRAEPGSVWDIGREEDVAPIAWPPQPEMVQLHLKLTRDAIDDMSFIPRTAQGELPAGVSGVSMGAANTPLQRILELKKPNRIGTLQAVAAFLLRMAEKKGAPIVTWCTVGATRKEARLVKALVDGDYYVDILWRNMLPRDEIAYEAHQAYLFKTGAQTLSRTLENLGVEWVEAEMEQLLEEYIDPRINPERAMAYAQAELALRQLKQAQAPAPQPQEMQPPAPQPQMPGMPPQLQLPGVGPGAQGQESAVQMSGGGMPVRPPAPSFQQMGQENRLTPFGPRELFGAGSLPMRPPGPGINVGGQG